jgi:hypothetical protein
MRKYTEINPLISLIGLFGIVAVACTLPFNTKIASTKNPPTHLPNLLNATSLGLLTPFNPTIIPEQLIYITSLSGGEGNDTYFETRFYNQQEFLVLYEVKAQPNEILPDGETILIKNQQATIQDRLSGTVNLAESTAQNGLPAALNSGGNPKQEEGPLSITYSNGSLLVWFMNGYRMVLLSNLTRPEIIAVAESICDDIDGCSPIQSPITENNTDKNSTALPGQSVCDSEFPPYVHTYIPAEFTGMEPGGGSGAGQSISYYINGDKFLIAFQNQISDESVLSEGTPINLNNGIDAFIENNLSGSTDQLDGKLPIIKYTQAKRLTYVINDVQIQILSNLSEDEVIKFAESISMKCRH